MGIKGIRAVRVKRGGVPGEKIPTVNDNQTRQTSQNMLTFKNKQQYRHTQLLLLNNK
jgi:hypothetical protein